MPKKWRNIDIVQPSVLTEKTLKNRPKMILKRVNKIYPPKLERIPRKNQLTKCTKINCFLDLFAKWLSMKVN